MSRRYRCCYCLDQPTRSTTSAGWPICDDCWHDGADGYAPEMFDLEEWSTH